MASRKLAIMVVIVAGLGIVAMELWKGQLQSGAPTESTPIVKSYFLPDISDQIASLDRVRIQSQSGEVNLIKFDDQWVLQENFNFPIFQQTLNQLLNGLVVARQIEKKTNRPRFYDRLGVANLQDADPSDAGHQVSLIAGDRVLAELMLGKTSPRRGGSYGRLLSEKTSWLIDQTFQLSTEPDFWLVKSVANLQPNAIRQVFFRNELKPLVVFRESPGQPFGLRNPPKTGQPIQPELLDQVGEALTNLTFVQVVPAWQVMVDSVLVKADFETYRGLVVEVQGAIQIDQLMLSLKAVNFLTDSDPAYEQVEDEVARLNGNWQDWVYIVDGNSFERFNRKLEDFWSFD